MLIIRKVKQMYQISRKLKKEGQSIGFVPTMGALHQGHASLIRQAVKDNNKVVVSIFVNPMQFGPREDFKKYPRDLKRDTQICRSSGTDVLFFPSVKEIYPDNFKTYVYVNGLDEGLCGKSRPGHFKGVTTVVSKLFNIVSPDNAYFGQKDAQQAVIIKKMVVDLNIPVKVKVMPTVREKNGLAMSSRNAYLSPGERRDALILSSALSLAKDLIKSGVRDTRFIISRIKGHIDSCKNAKIDYVSVVDGVTLEAIAHVKDKCLIALAVRIGKTRLIDNAIVNL